MKLVIARQFDLQKARRIKGHYRRLPNGKTVWIGEHTDKRREAKKDPGSFKGRIIHADDKETRYVNKQGEEKSHKHLPHMELTRDDIHSHLNKGMSVDTDLAMKVFMTENGITDINNFLQSLVDDEADKAETLGSEPEFTTRAEAMKWLHKNKIRDIHKELTKDHGEVTTPAKAFSHGGRLAEHFSQASTNPAFDEDHQALGKMAMEHAEDAHASAMEEMENVKAAERMTPQDCPHIDSLSSEIKFFGHQAQTLAQLNVLKKAIIDVDMGGGKGLILPADAMNLMGQGKVKKPLVVVPGATLTQNAQKIIEYTNGDMNVFMIDNAMVRDQYDGDISKMTEDIQKAPPNTIFMASYDVFSYQDRSKKPDDEDADIDQDSFPRAEALGGAGFDYVALDESHNIKNVKSKRFKAMQNLTHIPYKRVASGTFLSNNPKDVLGQMMFLHPHASISEKEFEEKYGFGKTAIGTQWDYNKLKNLRSDLKEMGMVSLRRSAWIHLLPKRIEKLAVVKMERHHEKVHEAVLNETLDQIEDELRKNPRLKKYLESDDDIDMDEEMPPNLLGPLNFLSAITDHPHELAVKMKEGVETVRAARKQAREEGTEVDAETELLRQQLARYSPAVRKAIISLEGTVSPKAKDVAAKIDEHFKDPNNGKFMVFVQRKLSAEHIMNNLPEKHKKNAMYFDASKMDQLPSFTQDPNGPKIMVAVDASIKEGINVQAANAQYRYDHHYSPGNQEQGYARNWRFGQDKDVNIHLGIVDGGIDVTKYARLVSKLHTNQLVVSDMEDDDSFEAYKLSLDNIRNHRHAALLDDYTEMNKKILDFQIREGVDLQKKFGSKGLPRAGKKKIGGDKAKMMHGTGPYISDIDYAKTALPTADESDKLLSHFRGQHKGEKSWALYDDGFESDHFNKMMDVFFMHKGRNAGVKPAEIEHTLKQYETESGEKLSPNIKKLFAGTLKDYHTKKHTPHVKHGDFKTAVKEMSFQHGYKKGLKYAHEDAEALYKHLKKNKKEFMHAGGGKVQNADIAKKFWDKLDKEAGTVAPTKYKQLVMGAVAILQEIHGGWDKVRYLYEDEE